MNEFQSLVGRTLLEGEWRDNRTAQRARSIFGHHMRFDLRLGFPLVTTKHVPFKSVVAELVGFIRGYTNAADFRALGTRIWDANANKTQSWLLNEHRRGTDDLGRIYGAQWRGWRVEPLDEVVGEYRTIDQLANLIAGIKRDPFGRRHIVSAWNPAEMDQMALPPCHVLFQCFVSEQGFLDLQMYQRSADIFLGVPFNIASYAALLEVLALATGLQPRYLLMCLGDAHLYDAAIDGAHTVMQRTALRLPQLSVAWSEGKTIDELEVSDFQLSGYGHHPAIPVEMAE